MEKLIKILWISFMVFAIIIGVAPFIIAIVTSEPWINWIGLLSVPASGILIVILLIQRKLLIHSDEKTRW